MRHSAAWIWQIVHRERCRLATDLSELPDEQWNVASLCPGWDVHDVLAHVVDTARTGRLAFVRELLRARMDFDRANDNGVTREKRRNPQETVDALDLAVCGRHVDRERLTGKAASRIADTSGRAKGAHEGHRP